jgi:hypothetical protein
MRLLDWFTSNSSLSEKVYEAEMKAVGAIEEFPIGIPPKTFKVVHRVNSFGERQYAVYTTSFDCALQLMPLRALSYCHTDDPWLFCGLFRTEEDMQKKLEKTWTDVRSRRMREFRDTGVITYVS